MKCKCAFTKKIKYKDQPQSRVMSTAKFAGYRFLTQPLPPILFPGNPELDSSAVETKARKPFSTKKFGNADLQKNFPFIYANMY